MTRPAGAMPALAEPSAADLAEEALLGALLWSPARVDDVGWLQATDFYRPAHQAIYTTILAHTRTGGDGSSDGGPFDATAIATRAAEVLASLATGRYHDLPVPRDGSGPLRAAAVFALMSMTPAGTTPKDGGAAGSDAHLRYAHLILEASIRRQVSAAGTRIGQCAGLGDSDPEQVVEGLDRAISALTDRLSGLAAQLAASTPGVSAGPPEGSAAPTTPAAATPVVAGNPPAECALLGACIANHRVRREALARLAPGDFTVPGAASTWRAIEDLSRGGSPIDFVLVAAQTEQAAGVYGPGLPGRQLMRLSQTFVDQASGYHALQDVTRTALLRLADRTRQTLATVAADRSRPSTALLISAQTALAAAGAAAARLNLHPPRSPDDPSPAARAARAASRALSGGADPRPAVAPVAGPAASSTPVRARRHPQAAASSMPADIARSRTA